LPHSARRLFDRKTVPAALTLALALAGAEENPVRKVEQALEAGRVRAADSLLSALPQNGRTRHKQEILSARLSGCRGRWREAETRLQAWKEHPRRRESTADILFWQAWAALHQSQRQRADSLLVLASAYAGENSSQKALEYRYAALVDSGAALRDYLQGLPESPLPDSLRLAALDRVPPASPLRPHARWEQYLFLETRDPARALEVLEDLARDPSTLPGRKAAGRWAYVKLESNHPDSALAAYERLLLQYQQGIPAEFARSRIQALKSQVKRP
jgi:hypothetical protein